MAWGAIVFVVSSFIALPVAAALFSSGDQISQMASKVGYGTFLTEHVLLGLALAVLLASGRLFASLSSRFAYGPAFRGESRCRGGRLNRCLADRPSQFWQARWGTQ
ncbi:MAG: hypothetical protein ABIP19_03080 [Dermatophilaceae bacterium]